MLVSDVLNFAVRGELKQLAISEINAADVNQAENIATLISYLNLGIIELHKRFPLITQSQTLTNTVNGANYTLTDDYLWLVYAEGNDTNETEIPINDENATFSIFEPAPYQLYIYRDNTLNTDITNINITYMATPPLLTDTSDVVPLQYQYIEALLLYIGARAHTAKSGLPNEENNTFYQRFEASIKRIKNNGNSIPDNQSNWKIYWRGFA